MQRHDRFSRAMDEALDGRSISWLARKTGVDRSTIHRWRSGACQPPIHQLVKVAAALGIDAEPVTRWGEE